MTSFPTALHHRIRELARLAPDAPAIAVPFQNDLRLSRGALDARASQLARQLRAAGVGAEVRVGVCVERSGELFVALLAVLKAGGVFVPLDPRHPAARLDWIVQDAQLRHGIVDAAGRAALGTPAIPDAFAALGRDRVIHSSSYLTDIDRLVASPDGERRRVAVIGAGQSAAEVFIDLARRFPHVDANLVMRAGALKPADDSPFVNEIFSPEFTDVVYAQPQDARRALLERYRDTNYAVVDRPLIEQIYEMLYLQRIDGTPRHALLANSAIEAAVRTADGRIELTLRDRMSGATRIERFDALVLATGYRRDTHSALLEGLAPHLGDALTRGDVTRDYLLATPEHFAPRIYLQGCCEDSHGLSDTLLSVLARRADEICASLENGIAPAHDEGVARATHEKRLNNGVSAGRMAFAL